MCVVETGHQRFTDLLLFGTKPSSESILMYPWRPQIPICPGENVIKFRLCLLSSEFLRVYPLSLIWSRLTLYINDLNDKTWALNGVKETGNSIVGTSVNSDQANIAENTEAAHCWPIVSGNHRWPVATPQKGSAMRFLIITLSGKPK